MYELSVEIRQKKITINGPIMCKKPDLLHINLLLWISRGALNGCTDTLKVTVSSQTNKWRRG
jgi:hypothetical protein